MAYLDPADAYTHLRDRVLEGIRYQFQTPIKGKTRTLELQDLEVEDPLHPDDIRGQQKAKMNGETWGSQVYGTLVMKDNLTGVTIDTKKVRLAEIPKTTRRYSYIVGGQEYQVDNQWQLKHGVYVRRRPNGDLEAQFNSSVRGTSMDVVFDPASKVFSVEYKKSKNLPLYPFLRAMGIGDEDMEKSWGKAVFEANKNARRVSTAIDQFYKTGTGQAAPSHEAALEHVRDVFAKADMRPEVNEVTLGKPLASITGETLHRATDRLLDMQRGGPEDDRDSLVFKDLRSAGDFAYDNLRNFKRTNINKLQRQLNNPKTTGIRDVVRFDYLNEPIKQFFTKSSIANPATQINPLQMVSTAMQTTIMGPGGIKSERSISDEAKLINPSHLGFLDPINTPESEKTGVTLRLPMGIRKKGMEATVAAYNLKTGKVEDVTPVTFMKSRVVLPDQVDWKTGKPHPIASKVKMVGEGNRVEEKPFADADYVLRHPSQLFNVTSNLIPFLPNDSGGRAGMASRHMEQAISLLHRQAPLVQVAAPTVPGGGITSFEQLVGFQTSHRSTAAGTISKIKKDAIIITDKDGKDHEVQIYNNYPLNDVKSVMHSVPTVKVGDKVSKGQLIADTNYSRNGTLSLGTNLRVAYIPFKGYNFEDGIVISDSAARKLSSVHLHKPQLKIENNTILNPRKFSIAHSGMFKPHQYEKLDEMGVVKTGQTVKPGDPLILAMRPFELKDRTGLSAVRKALSAQHIDNSVRWDSDFEGEVVAVHKTPEKITVHVKTLEPMQVGDKLSGRHGNKGIVTKILSDDEMPKSKTGGPIDVLLNPSGVPGRMNVGQVLETAAAKIAEKTKKPYLVDNFDPKNPDALSRVKAELKAHGLSDTEEVYDPVTKQPLGHALVGPQYMLKLVHQIEKKLSMRSGMTLPGLQEAEPYDVNLQPSSGGHTGGQSLSHLALYSLLAHGAKANIREMHTWKSEGPDPHKKWTSQHLQVWTAIQQGTPLPPPKSTFAFKKFTDMLKGAGINVEKQGYNFILGPLTDKQILGMSGGELTQADKSPVRAKIDKSGEFVAMPGGLFDERLTGGHGGTKWAHLRLAEPVPNPVFEDAIKKLTGIQAKQFDAIMLGDQGVDAGSGKIVSPKLGITGGAGIKALLDRIDVKKELETSKGELQKTPISKADRLLKKVKYLTSLQRLELKPSEAYILHNIPVIPPVIRPLTMMADGGLKYEDVNGLYKQFETINNRLKDPVLASNLTDRKKRALRDAYYDGVKAIMGVGTINKDKKEKGLLDQIAGASPKEGYFQSALTNRRQDLTMRSTIVPEPSLGLDEIGLPKEAALTLFRPFVIRQLVLQGTAPTALHATAVLSKVHKGEDNPMVWRALDRVMDERPVLLKRDPALHKYSVQAFKPRVVSGSAIQIHPLVTGGFNADFDGDTMAVYVPISHEAVREAQRMFPSNNVFNEASGHVMYQPTLESALGLYKLSITGKKTSDSFKTPEEVIESLRQGKNHYTDVVMLDGRKTTPGRVLLSSVLPGAIHNQVLHDLDFHVDKKGLESVLTQVGKNNESRGKFGRIADDVKNLGYDAAFGVVRTPLSKSGVIAIGTHSLSLEDFTPDTATREAVLHKAQQKVDEVQASRISPSEKDRRSIDIWDDATKEMKKEHEKKAAEHPSNLFLMQSAGVKPGWDQYKQMVLAPMIYKDSFDRDIPLAVTKSYAEGLDLGGYWTQLYGARRGAVMKVQEVREPGALSKLLMNSSMNLLVEKKDCGTKKGIVLPVSDADIHDRHLAQAFHAGSLHVPEGTLLTPDIVGQMRKADKNAKILVRSPLKCEAEHGICQNCLGPSVEGQDHEFGTNIGVIAAQSVGERAMQLMLKGFHTGGVREAGGGSKVINQFDRFKALTELPAKIPNAATLVMGGGKIERIVPTETGVDIYINGTKHFVGRDPNGNPLHTPLPGANKDPKYIAWDAPMVGDFVKPGELLSDPNRTAVNPHDLYRATGSIDEVQNHIASEMDKIYENQGVRRRMLETVVKAMSNLTKVEDPGDHPYILRGEFHPTSVIKRINETDLKGKMPILHKPVLKGVDMLPLSLQEDWMAKMQHAHLKNTLYEAAAQGLTSNLHGPHPVPGMAYGAEFGQPPRGVKGVAEHHY